MDAENTEIKTLADNEIDQTLEDYLNEQAKKIDDPLKAAREAGNTWTFKGKEYELYLVNGTGGVALPIVVDGETVGIVGAEFAWEDSEAFLEYLNFNIRREVNVKDQTSQQKSADENVQGARFFRDTVQKGFLIEFDEVGQRKEPVDLTRAELMDLVDFEMQAALAIRFITGYQIERHFREGESKLRAALKTQDSVLFEFYIPNQKNAKSVLLLEFAAPTKDARTDYGEKAVYEERGEQDGNILPIYTRVDNEYKLRFAKKYFRGVKGVTLGDVGKPFVDGDDEHTKAFKHKQGFNPRWWIALADALVGSFHNAGK